MSSKQRVMDEPKIKMRIDHSNAGCLTTWRSAWRPALHRLQIGFKNRQFSQHPHLWWMDEGKQSGGSCGMSSCPDKTMDCESLRANLAASMGGTTSKTVGINILQSAIFSAGWVDGSFWTGSSLSVDVFCLVSLDSLGQTERCSVEP